MPSIGEELLQPESGWKRFEDTDPNISYIGQLYEYRPYYHTFFPALNKKILFNFVGTKLRLYFETNSNGNYSNGNITINNKTSELFRTNYPSSSYSPNRYTLVYEIDNLSFKEHSIEIEGLNTNYLIFNAVDIDENGELKPYNPNISSIITWSPNDKTVNYTLSNNNLAASLSKDPPYGYHGIKATKYITNGKFYAEFLVNDMPNVCTLGLATYEASLSGYTSITQFPNNIKTRVINALKNTFIGMAFDLDNHFINFYINGVLDAKSTITLENKEYTVIMMNNNGENKGGAITANFGETPFNIITSNKSTWDKLITEGYRPYDFFNANWDWKISKYLLKQDNNYYSINNNYINLGEINNNKELDNLINEYGYNDLSIIIKELNTRKVPTTMENDYYKSFNINLNDIKDNINIIDENDKKYIEYDCNNYKISDEIKKISAGKFEVLMKEI
ncbi:cell adhesion protein [Clostridium sporogenes]